MVIILGSLIYKNNFQFYKEIYQIDNAKDRIYLPLKKNNIFEIKPLNNIEIFIDNTSSNIIDYFPNNYNNVIKLLLIINPEYITNNIKIEFDKRIFGYDSITKIINLILSPNIINTYELISFNNGKTWSFFNITSYDYSPNSSSIPKELVVGIKKPIIETGYISDDDDKFQISTSLFENINIEFPDTHISTIYQIYEDKELTKLKQNIRVNNTNLNDYIFDISSLDNNTSYYIICKYIGKNFESEFSDPYKFDIYRGYSIEITKDEFLEADTTLKYNNLIIDKFKDLLIDNNIENSIINIDSNYGNSIQYGSWEDSYNKTPPHIFSFKAPDNTKLNYIKATLYCGANSTNTTYDLYITSKDVIDLYNNEFAIIKPLDNVFINNDCVTQSNNQNVSKSFIVPYSGTLLLQLKVVQYRSGWGCIVNCTKNSSIIVNGGGGKNYWGNGYNNLVTIYNGSCTKGDIITVSALKYTGGNAGWASAGYVYVYGKVSNSNNLFFNSTNILNNINYNKEYTLKSVNNLSSNSNQIFKFISPTSKNNITNSPVYLSSLKINFK